MIQEQFSVREVNDGNICLITFGETLDSKLGSSFIEVIADIIESGQRHFIFDFKYTKIVQSPAVAVIVESASIVAEKENCQLYSCNMSEILEKIFEMVGLFMFASHFENDALAIESVNKILANCS